jgi:hypothetical protein
MGNKLVLNNANIISDNIDATIFNMAKISDENSRLSPAAFTKVAEADSNFYSGLNIKGLSLKPQLEVLSSIFHGLCHAIKVTILIALSFVYVIIALPAVILYIIFYKHLVEKLINKVRQNRRKSPYYFKWKNHHLDLNWEA